PWGGQFLFDLGSRFGRSEVTVPLPASQDVCEVTVPLPVLQDVCEATVRYSAQSTQ
ncbi:MAG: hypothetical protein RL628_2154, partial [Actinomycetota bacterium]